MFRFPMWSRSLVAGMAWFLSGCGGRDLMSGGAAAPVPKGNFASRFDAANKITGTAEKDSALAALAADAAKGGDVEVVKKCIQSLTSSAVKDAAAYTVAIELARVGKGEDAKVIAEGIIRTKRRNEALARIAKDE